MTGFGQFGPNAREILWAQISAGYDAADSTFNRGAMLCRHHAATCAPVRDRALRQPNGTGQLEHTTGLVYRGIEGVHMFGTVSRS